MSVNKSRKWSALPPFPSFAESGYEQLFKSRKCNKHILIVISFTYVYWIWLWHYCLWKYLNIYLDRNDALVAVHCLCCRMRSLIRVKLWLIACFCLHLFIYRESVVRECSLNVQACTLTCSTYGSVNVRGRRHKIFGGGGSF